MKIPFTALKTEGKSEWTGTDLLMLSFELARQPGETAWLEIDNVASLVTVYPEVLGVTMDSNRRDLLKGIAAAPLFLPASARGANDRPTFGAIGVGNRGRWLHNTFQKLGAQCLAVCDVYAPFRERALSESICCA